MRERTFNILKRTIETVLTLTNEACSSTVAVYALELDDSWRSYTEAYVVHEDILIGKEQLDLVALLQTIQEQYLEMRASHIKAKIKIGKLASPNGHNITINGLNASLYEQATSSEREKTFKLPFVRLPIFSGDAKDWVEFKATCRSVLTNRVHDVQRLQLLKGALTGEPRELISHILPADGAYDKAMILLKQRYENERAIVNRQLHRLYTLPHNEPQRESASTLRYILNTINSLVAALNGCDIDTSTWNSILIFNSSQCLHADSRKAWEEKLDGSRAIPTLQKYLDFLESRINIVDSTTEKPLVEANASMQTGDKESVFYNLRSDYQCAICQRNHLPSRCDKLAQMAVADRRSAVKKANICFNCLQAFHTGALCPFEAACKTCRGKHHTLLHENQLNVMLAQTAPPEDVTQRAQNNELLENDALSEHFHHITDSSVTILATALVPIQYNGRSIIVRALVDQGSTTNLITEKMSQLLNIPFEHHHTSMTGIGNTSLGHGIGRASFSFGSIRDNSYDFATSALMVNSVATIAPLAKNKLHQWNHLANLALADPQFLEANKIDLLLGAAVYAEIILDGVVKGNPGEPIAQKTKLGYIVFGQSHTDRKFIEPCKTVHSYQFDDGDADLCQSINAYRESGPSAEKHAQFQRIAWQLSGSNKFEIHESSSISCNMSGAPLSAIRTIDEVGKMVVSNGSSLIEKMRKYRYVDDGVKTTAHSSIKYLNKISRNDNNAMAVKMQLCGATLSTQLSNRCAQMLIANERLPKNHWNYVLTQLNQTHTESRGAMIVEFAKDDLWWLGQQPMLESNSSAGKPKASFERGSPELIKNIQTFRLVKQAESYVLEGFLNRNRLVKITVLVGESGNWKSNQLNSTQPHEFTAKDIPMLCTDYGTNIIDGIGTTLHQWIHGHHETSISRS